MTLPENVQRQAQQAQQLQQQLMNPSRPEAHRRPPAQAPAPATQPDAEPRTAPPSNEPGPQAADKKALYWQNRFNVLQGKYNAEIPALQARVRELEQQLAQAHSPAAHSEPSPQQAIATVASLTRDEIDEFGPELVQLVERVAGNVANHANHQTSQQLHQVTSELNQLKDERAQDAAARFWTELHSAVPDFQQINADPAWLAWLNGTDVLSGQSRQQLLQQAQQSHDVYRVAALFNAFKAHTAPAPARQVPAALQQPPQSRPGDMPARQPHAWSGAQISQFYKDASLGKYTPAQKAAIEQEIFEAQRAGRVNA